MAIQIYELEPEETTHAMQVNFDHVMVKATECDVKFGYEDDQWVKLADHKAERAALAERVVRLEAERDYWQEAFGSWSVGDKMATSEARRVGDAAVAKSRKEKR